MRALVVDDEDAVRTGVERALVADGFHVDAVDNGTDGLRLLLDGDYDLAILDIMLPGVNGYEICRTGRARGVTTPIVLLSAKDGEWDIADGFDLGADDYLTKPFSTVELVARARARARRADGPERLLGTRTLALDPDLRTCRRGDRTVDLTEREVSLLAVLIAHVGTVVPKQDLLDEVWGAEHDPAPNVLEVYVARLRRKLDDPFGTQDIQTIRGVGYRLVDRPS
jgi:DNA-binding response OmpR family regulator